jgi:hypothetical protein
MADRIKRYKSKDHVTINNAIMKERDITLKAKGLFSLVMSLPDDWDFSIKGICAIIKENYTAVNSAINELIEAGYCRRERIKENGKFVGCNYEFSEVKMGSPRLGFLNVENPRVENLNDNNNSSINTPIIDKENEYKRLSNDNQKETDELFETFWSLYDYKKGKDKALKSWKRLKKDEKEKAIKCISEYKEDCRRNSRQMKHPSTFLNQKTWEDDFSCDGMVKVTEEQNEPDKTWEPIKEWLDSTVPLISNGISPNDFAIMKSMTESSQQMAKILVEINNTCPDGDIMSNFKRILHEQA